MVPLKVAILATFLVYRYKFVSRAKDKNLYRLPKWTKTWSHHRLDEYLNNRYIWLKPFPFDLEEEGPYNILIYYKLLSRGKINNKKREVYMTNYQLVSDYKDVDTYKESFNELAKNIFELDFKKWYEKGCWNDNYICYSFVDGDKVIANASINKMTLVSNGKEYKAIQVGTVMTHPDYRNQGLSGKLMNHIIEVYEQEYDFIYLFANESVLDFYPKFGFEKVQESSFSLKFSGLEMQQATTHSLRRLDTNNTEDFRIMEEFAANRIPVSSIMGVKNNEHLLMFYFILAFNEAIYYIEEVDAIVIFEQEDKHLHIFDIISKQTFNYDTILNSIVSDNTEIVHFYFTPDYDHENLQKEFITESDDTLFVRPLCEERTKHFLIPLTSHS